MKIFITILLIAFTVSVYAQKPERSETTSDFTTTPFQDEQAKGLNPVMNGFYFVEEGFYKEGNEEILIPMTFTDAFDIQGNIMILKMVIYDMQGTLIYEGKMKNNWDGKKNDGTIVDNNLYIYTIEGRILPGKISKIAGFVRIAR